MNHPQLLPSLIVALTSLTLTAAAANWPQWRGPNFNGSSPEKNLPSLWSKTDGVAWSLDLPGPSAATPVIWDDRVFVSTTDLRTKSLHALCVDRKSGKILWQQQTSVGMEKDNRSNFASPSPVTDGEQVFFFYGNGELVAFDLAGQKQWSRNVQKDYGDFAFLWTFSSSPLLYEGKLFLQVLQRDVPVQGRGFSDKPNDSYLLALDPKTGKELWRAVRPSEAVAESREAFTTPVPYEFNGRKEILVAGGDCLTGHAPANGQELWRWGTWNPTKIGHWRLVPSPVAGDGVILGCAPKRDPIYAVRAGGNGVLDDSALAWVSRDNRAISSDVGTPLFYDGDFFILNKDGRSLSRVEPKTGQVKWTIETPGRKIYESSPTGAGGKIYFMNFGGDVVVASAANGEILNTIAMGDPDEDGIRSSVAAAHGQLFIRTNKKLYCVGKSDLLSLK